MKRYEDAIATYNTAVEIKPNHYEAWYSRGNALVNLKRYKEAIDSFDKALQYKPDYREAVDARNKAQNQLNSGQKKPEEKQERKPENHSSKS